MQQYFVWCSSWSVEIIQAKNPHDAAEEFLGLAATSVAVPGEPPACFVQPIGDREAPRPDGTAVAFWASDDFPAT